VNYNDLQAMARLREVKRRSEGKHFSVLIAQKGLITNYTSYREPILYKLIDEYWPGPLTVVVPDHEERDTIGVRMPHHKIALSLVQESQCTVAAPSANIEGNPPPRTCQEALRDLDGLVDVAIDGGAARIGQASSVVDFTQEKPTVLREGVIAQQDVDRITQRKTILFVCTGNSCRSVMGEYLLRNMLKDRDDVEVFSAGTGVFLQSSASAETVMVLRREGIDARGHVSRPVNTIMLSKADLILVMTRNHRQQVLERVPGVEKRVYLLKEFAGGASSLGVNLDIPDPIGKPAEAYEECMLTIKDALEHLVKLL
ncbi:MAG: L-threonylcarbamoyladenylate synthase, partial [Candidatus Omnitrophica bacterium]|nr:L-threonylcarbamoyladenylate synthase [Candidatus Omnitrophota bacterium]